MKVNDAKKALLYGKALRFVRMAAQTLDTQVPDPSFGANEATYYTEAMEALDRAAARLSMLKGTQKPKEKNSDNPGTHAPPRPLVRHRRAPQLSRTEAALVALLVESGTARAVREGLLRPRTIEPRGIVIHTTGAGPWARWHRNPERYESPYEAAKYVYERISKYSGHYLIDGDTGFVSKLVDPMVVAWHVGSKGAWRYRLPGWAKGKGFGWWTTRFKGCTSPRDLLDGALWRKGSANALTIGIEVSPPREGPRAEWSDKAWRSLRLITHDLGRRFGIPIDRYHVFTHSDAHPLARTRKDGSPWDPGPSQWTIGRAAQELVFR